jgi:hypothetical protein
MSLEMTPALALPLYTSKNSLYGTEIVTETGAAASGAVAVG